MHLHNHQIQDLTFLIVLFYVFDKVRALQIGFFRKFSIKIKCPSTDMGCQDDPIQHAQAFAFHFQCFLQY